jgi:hypothetical protein
MAGLLNMLGQGLGWLNDPNQMLDRMQQEKNAKKYEGLLAQQQGQPIHLGIPNADQPQQGPGGLLNQNSVVGPQFFLKAAAIPGYEALAGGAQSGMQAMDRQTQEQGWSQNNMTMAQAQSAEIQRQQMAQQAAMEQARIDQAERQFGSLSAYQKAQIAAQGQPGAMTQYQQAQIDLENRKLDAGPRETAPTGYRFDRQGGLLAIPGGPAAIEQELAVAPLDTALATIDQAIEYGKKYGSYESGPGSLNMSQQLKNDVVRGLQVATQAQTLGESEAERLGSQAWDFNAKGNAFTRDDTALAKLKALKSTMSRQRDAILKAQGKQRPKAELK